ncbi:1570_t:CDS:2 [Acaulospora morrowiae]|uniref:1570_t:CDS:1 n=1 Tax=Acaulospora morrowiae TaxID=94023 RepID=A0A9N8ZR07_9GLOM|nr:1570_t:CDS:2 [Acaulospora morrowiae]
MHHINSNQDTASNTSHFSNTASTETSDFSNASMTIGSLSHRSQFFSESSFSSTDSENNGARDTIDDEFIDEISDLSDLRSSLGTIEGSAYWSPEVREDNRSRNETNDLNETRNVRDNGGIIVDGTRYLRDLIILLRGRMVENFRFYSQLYCEVFDYFIFRIFGFLRENSSYIIKTFEIFLITTFIIWMSFDIQLLPDEVTHFVCLNSPVVISQTFLPHCENFFVPDFSKLVETQIQIHRELSKPSELQLNTEIPHKSEISFELSLDSLARDIQESVLATRDLIDLVKDKSYEQQQLSSESGSYKFESPEPDSPDFVYSEYDPSSPFESTSFEYKTPSDFKLTKFHGPEIANIENQIIKELIEYSDNSFEVVKELKRLQLLVHNSLDGTINLIVFTLENLISIKEKSLSLQQYKQLKEMTGVRNLLNGKRRDLKESASRFIDLDNIDSMNFDWNEGEGLSFRQCKQVRDIYKVLLLATNEDLKKLYSGAYAALEGLRYIQKSQFIISNLFSAYEEFHYYNYHNSNTNIQNLNLFSNFWSFFGNHESDDNNKEETKIFEKTMKLFKTIDRQQNVVNEYILNIIDHVKDVQKKLKKLRGDFVIPGHVDRAGSNMIKMIRNFEDRISKENELKVHLIHMKKRLLELRQEKNYV